MTPSGGYCTNYVFEYVPGTLTVIDREPAPAQPGTTIRVAAADALPGSTVTLSVTVEGNPGILATTFELSYDEGLTLVGAEGGEVLSSLDLTRPPALVSPCRLAWDGIELPEDGARDGEVLVLTFVVGKDIEPGSVLAVSISADVGAIVDGELAAVDVGFIAGGVTALDYVPGDVDGDGTVNSRDVVCVRRHLVGWPVVLRRSPLGRGAAPAA